MTYNPVPEPWKAFLHEIDDHLEERTDLHCIGGFVIAMLYGLQRPTSDVDVISCEPRRRSGELFRFAGIDSELYKKYRLYLEHVGVAKLPENYEERLTEMFPGEFKKLKLLAVEPHDLALSKLDRNTSRDREDVLHLAKTVPLDLRLLKTRYIEELRYQAHNEDREDLTIRLWINMIEELRNQE